MKDRRIIHPLILFHPLPQAIVGHVEYVTNLRSWRVTENRPDHYQAAADTLREGCKGKSC